MKQLIIFARPGIAVVSGTVRYVERGKIMIENNLYLPVSKKIETRQMEIDFPESKVRNLKLKVGAFVLATIKDDDPALNEVIHGGETNTTVFSVSGYNIRYSGTFDFDGYGNYKETHVLSGKVQDIIRGDDGYVKFTLASWKCGQPIESTISIPLKRAPGIKDGQKVAVVTGEFQTMQNQYEARRIVDLAGR